MADSPTRSGVDPHESSNADETGDSADASSETGTSFTYHRSGDGEQVLLGLETDGVHVSVAFDEGTNRSTLDEALDAQRRELDHYYETTTASR